MFLNKFSDSFFGFSQTVVSLIYQIYWTLHYYYTTTSLNSDKHITGSSMYMGVFSMYMGVLMIGDKILFVRNVAYATNIFKLCAYYNTVKIYS
jgi:hypothetical protein